jgi:hypothetical protein
MYAPQTPNYSRAESRLKLMLAGFGSLHTQIAKLKKQLDESHYSIFREDITSIAAQADTLKIDAEYVLAALEPPAPAESEKVAAPDAEPSAEGTGQVEGQAAQPAAPDTPVVPQGEGGTPR